MYFKIVYQKMANTTYKATFTLSLKSIFIPKREAVNRVIQRYRPNYLQREKSARIGRKYKFIWWLSLRHGRPRLYLTA